MVSNLGKIAGATAFAALLALPVMSTPAAAAGVSIGIGIPAYGPPPPRWETRPSRPWREAVWVDGHWQWSGHRYVWVNGHWDRPGRGFTRWDRGRWEHGPHGWTWVDGRWR
jgi:hypothetical protein